MRGPVSPRRASAVLAIGVVTGAAGAWLVIAASDNPTANGAHRRPPRDAFVRDCDSPRVLIRPDRRDRARSVVAGSLWLLALREFEESSAKLFEPRKDNSARYDPLRVLVRVGASDAVVEVAREAQGRLGLLYDDKKFRRRFRNRGYRVSDGESAVKFESCGRSTVYEGSIVAAGSGCYSVDIWLEGRSTPVRRTFGLATEECPGS